MDKGDWQLQSMGSQRVRHDCVTLSQRPPEEDSLPWFKAKRIIPFLFLVIGLGKGAYDQ